MKKLIVLFGLLILCLLNVQSQDWLRSLGEKAKDAAKRTVENKVETKIEEAANKAMDKTEEAVEKSIKKDKKTKSSESTQKNEDAENKENISYENKKSSQKVNVSYTKYDFVPGNEVIFEDDLKNEQKGEFPGKWDLVEGNAEIAQIDGENTLAIVGYTYITPLFKDKAYKLPDEFTMEFDVYIDGNDGENTVEFFNNNGNVIALSLFWKQSERFLFKWNITEDERTSEDTYDNSQGWHHYALSFNKRAVKVYVDAKRVANIPNVTEKPVKVMFFARGSEDNSAFHIKNVRIAKGAVPLYSRLMTDGRIITYGISFETGKATLKPQSMGTINEIFDILNKYPDLRFSVEGHTDNTGNVAFNQTLSEARAKAVCDKLQEMGIEAGRLTAKGYGMSKPVDSNETPEGRAKNRRVEFVKIK